MQILKDLLYFEINSNKKNCQITTYQWFPSKACQIYQKHVVRKRVNIWNSYIKFEFSWTRTDQNQSLPYWPFQHYDLESRSRSTKWVRKCKAEWRYVWPNFNGMSSKQFPWKGQHFGFCHFQVHSRNALIICINAR